MALGTPVRGRAGTRDAARQINLRGGHGGPLGDRLFRGVTVAFATAILVLLAAIFLILFNDARAALAKEGLRFLTGQVWNPGGEVFGALPYIFGTVFTSALALLIATPLAIGAALFIVEYAPPWLRTPVSFTVELLAVIPSVIYGLWGIYILAPFMRDRVERPLKAALGDVPVLNQLVSGPVRGRDILVASVILAIMILPTIMSVAREIISTVPDTQREGMLALGATKWETIRGAVLPYARAGIIGAAILGLGRAVGETMAVTMVIGNSSTRISPSLLTPGYTLASAIANQFSEADSPIHFSAVVALALVLLFVTALVNLLARVIVARFTGGPSGDVRATGI
ncbi:MAG: phosphate ABC transporter permease subunit PstC [Chloroflexota bacterium]|nr:phosphate ABC transporter permease subunit PstC [Chloroflexota bacterium]